ncbi:MAG: UDP-N-acetylmuramoyl-tripeptide--D-alanyl-D-alanine ligase [Lentisphaeria bacterium]|nr:UDP-N-acetylmuramoyl-tripeptide--D-alanyl-D-alanine ligase [Lentisphaeria bacterium]
MIALSLEEIVSFCGGRLAGADGAYLIKKAETDSRKDMTDGIFFALKGERFDAHDFLKQAMENNAAVLCVQNGREIAGAPCWCVDDTLQAYQKLGSLMLRKAAVTSVAITGSVGKTSVKEMTRAVLEEKFGAGAVLFTEGNTNNHIGVPQNLMRLTEKHKVAVIEMGTSSFGEIGVLSEIVRPEAALINSIAPCHLENLGSLEGVAKEKSAIFDFAGKLAVIPGNIPQTAQIKAAAEAKGLSIKYFGNSASEEFFYSDFKGSIAGSSFVLHCGGEKVVVNWNLQGEHQAQNACGAAAIGKYFGMTIEEIAAGLQKTSLPGMRAKITEVNGVHLYNDAYNANPASMHALLKMVKESIKNGEFAEKNVIFVLGDMLELGDSSAVEHQRLLQAIKQELPQVRVLAAGANFMQYKGDFAMNFFADSVQAGEYLKTVLQAGDWVFFKGSRSMHIENAMPGDEWR